MSTSPPGSAAALKSRALRLLARREHSRAELARKLAPQAESPATLDLLLKELEERKQLSDERYAEQRSRTLGRKYGPAKIRHELRSKGVADEIVARISFADELALARAILSRRYRTAPASREERARRARFLQGRGFSMEAIGRLLSSSATE